MRPLRSPSDPDRAELASWIQPKAFDAAASLWNFSASSCHSGTSSSSWALWICTGELPA